MSYHRKNDLTRVASFTIPESTLAALERVVPLRQRSRYVAELLQREILNTKEDTQTDVQRKYPST